MKKKRKGTFFSTKGKISTGDWGKIYSGWRFGRCIFGDRCQSLRLL